MTRPVDNQFVLGYSEKSLGGVGRAPQVEPTCFSAWKLGPPQDVTLWGAAFWVIEKCLSPDYGYRRTIQCTNRPTIKPTSTSLKSASRGTSFPAGPTGMIAESPW